MIIKSSTRWVILSKNYAWKMPSFWSWKNFLTGLLANLQEVEFNTMKAALLCPVSFHLPLGFLVVMPRGEHLTHDEWYSMEIRSTVDFICHEYPVERKHDSFAWLPGRKFVAVDYGS